MIPNEYGIDPGSKLRIGSKICCALLGKLLADLANMREESLATAVRALKTLYPERTRGVYCSWWTLLGEPLAVCRTLQRPRRTSRIKKEVGMQTALADRHKASGHIGGFACRNLH